MTSLWKIPTLVAAAIVLFSSADQAATFHILDSPPQSGFRLKITVPDTDRPEFFVPGVSGMFTLIPTVVDNAKDRSGDRPTYIKVTPRREGSALRIIVSVLYGKFDKTEPIYDQIKDHKQKAVAEFLVGSNENVSVSQLKEFGVKPIEIEVIPDYSAPGAQL